MIQCQSGWVELVQESHKSNFEQRLREGGTSSSMSLAKDAQEMHAFKETAKLDVGPFMVPKMTGAEGYTTNQSPLSIVRSEWFGYRAHSDVCIRCLSIVDQYQSFKHDNQSRKIIE